MGSIDLVEALRRTLTYDKSVVYKAIIAFFFAVLAKLGNHGMRMETGDEFFSMFQ